MTVDADLSVGAEHLLLVAMLLGPALICEMAPALFHAVADKQQATKTRYRV